MAENEFKGLVQIYTGDGKGKTTAALGQALRAAGQGLKVIFFQFLKGEEGGEHYFTGKFKPFEIVMAGEGDIFSKSDDLLMAEARSLLEQARTALLSGGYDLVVLDEIFIAHWRGFISQQDILALLEARPAHVELVLTGRKAPAEVVRRADLVTEMLMIKHPYTAGVTQRKGIEY